VNRIENGAVEVRLAAATRGHAAYQLRAIGNRLRGVEGALFTSETLNDDLGVFVNQNGH
jgi:hypothetical protein